MTDLKGAIISDKNAAVVLKVKKGDTIITADTETSGLSCKTAEILSISGIVSEFDGSKLIEKSRFNFFIRNKYEIPSEASDVNGLTSEVLAEYPYEEDVIEKIYPILGNNPKFIVGHNVGFDIRFIQAMYERQNRGSFEPLNVIDTCACAKDCWSKAEIDKTLEEQMLPKKEEYRLQTLVPLFGLDDGLEFHLSMDDVIATNRLLEKEIKFFKENWKLDYKSSSSTEIKVLYVEEKRYSGLKCPQPVRGDYLTVGTNTGLYRFDKVKRSWKIANEFKKVSLEDVISAVVSYLGLEKDDDLQYWHPEAKPSKDFSSDDFVSAKKDAGYIIPIGKFAGLPISELPKQKGGLDYARWAAANMHSDAGKHFKLFIDNYSA